MADHTLAAETELAAMKHKAKLQNEKEEFVVGPFGKLHELRPFISQSYAFRDPKAFLHSPELLITDPEPGFRYAWPIGEDPQTAARLRAGVYKKVRIEECKPDTLGEVTTHKGTNGTEVRWYKHTLVKIHPKAWAELYEAPAAFSMTRLSQEVESFKDKVTRESRGVAKPSAEIGTDPEAVRV